MDIFQMSFSASVLIGVVVIIRSVFLNSLPKKTFLILWSVVILRLLVPFSIPSQFSFYTGIDMVKRMFLGKTDALFPTEVLVMPNISTAPVTMETYAAVQISLVEIIWLIGICCFALFFIVTYIKCHREFKMSLPVKNDFISLFLQENSLHRSVQVQQSDRIKAPLTYGVLRPVILLPKKTDWTDKTKLQYILTHELVHIRRYDTLTKLLLTAAVCVHWFNPFVWMMYILANRDIELLCDETVVRTLGETIKSEYAFTLIGLEEKKSRFTPLVNNFSKNAIEERIVMIMKMKKTSFMGMLMALVLVLGTITVFATNADAGNNPKINNGNTTSEINSAVVISRNDKSGKAQISIDNGKTWVNEDEYAKKFPTPEIEWWTYDEYKVWLDNEKVQLQDMIGEKGWNPTEGWYVLTQQRIDETIKMYENILEEIKNGLKVSKTNGGDDQIMYSYKPSDISTTYGISLVNDKGEEATFGPYNTKEEMLDVIKPYCDEQVKAGKMTKQEADEIIGKYK